MSRHRTPPRTPKPTTQALFLVSAIVIAAALATAALAYWPAKFERAGISIEAGIW